MRKETCCKIKKYGFVLCVTFIICLFAGCTVDERAERAQRAVDALLTCPTEKMVDYVNGKLDENPEEFIRSRFQAEDFTEDGLKEVVNMSMTSWLLDGMCVEEGATICPENIRVQMEDKKLCIAKVAVNVQTQVKKCTMEIKLRVQFDSQNGKIRYIAFDDTALSDLYMKIKN